MRLLTLNVRGFNDYVRQATADFMDRHKADIICIQETYAEQDNPQWQQQFPNHRMYHSFGTNHSRGVSIIIRENTDQNCRQLVTDPDGRHLLLEFFRGKFSFYLLCVYAPTSPSERTEFYQHIVTMMQRFPETQTIVCGDFNIVLDPRKDRISEARLRPRTSDTNNLHDLINSLDLTDIYRQKHPHVPGYTWTREQPKLAARLDMFLISVTLEHLVADATVVPAAFSDHQAVFLQLVEKESTEQRGPNYWKFNRK